MQIRLYAECLNPQTDKLIYNLYIYYQYSFSGQNLQSCQLSKTVRFWPILCRSWPVYRKCNATRPIISCIASVAVGGSWKVDPRRILSCRQFRHNGNTDPFHQLRVRRACALQRFCRRCRHCFMLYMSAFPASPFDIQPACMLWFVYHGRLKSRPHRRLLSPISATTVAGASMSVATGGKGGQLPPNRPWTRSWDMRKSDEKCEHKGWGWETITVKTESHLCGYFLKIQLRTWRYNYEE